MGKKIATCCYCGTRSILVLDDVRHELTCSACGAPLHEMKFMPQSPEKMKKKTAKPKAEKGKKAGAYVGVSGRSNPRHIDKESRKRKKKKPVFRRFLEDIFDEIEDIFD